MGLPQSAASQDAVRDKFDGEDPPDFDLALTEVGEWVNYTRTFPEGHYEIRFRVQNVSATGFTARVDGSEIVKPVGIAVGSDGQIWTVDTHNGQVIRIDPRQN